MLIASQGDMPQKLSGGGDRVRPHGAPEYAWL
jgi:hypothetical protein